MDLHLTREAEAKLNELAERPAAAPTRYWKRRWKSFCVSRMVRPARERTAASGLSGGGPLQRFRRLRAKPDEAVGRLFPSPVFSCCI